MRIAVRSRHRTLDDAFRAFVERRMYFALSRFSDRIRRTTLTLADASRGSGAAATAWRICVVLRTGEQLLASGEDDSPERAVAGAADRAAWVVARELDRNRLPGRVDRRYAMRFTTPSSGR